MQEAVCFYTKVPYQEIKIITGSCDSFERLLCESPAGWDWLTACVSPAGLKLLFEVVISNTKNVHHRPESEPTSSGRLLCWYLTWANGDSRWGGKEGEAAKHCKWLGATVEEEGPDLGGRKTLPVYSPFSSEPSNHTK